MTIRTSFSVPPDIASGLLNGTLTRRGGVIQEPSGKIVTWLRENNPEHMAPCQLVKPGSVISNSLAMTGSVASVLNLGATVAFGVAAIFGLSKVNRKLDEIVKNIDKLQWTVELGFMTTIEALDRIEGWLTTSILATLRSAADRAWTAQMLEPGSSKREIRLENAYSDVDKASAHLLQSSCSQMKTIAADFLGATPGSRIRRAIQKDSLSLLAEIRLTLRALDLKLNLLAETGTPSEAANSILDSIKDVREGFCSMMVAFLGCCSSKTKKGQTPAYPLLMHPDLLVVYPMKRIGQWAANFDNVFAHDAASVNDKMREMRLMPEITYGQLPSGAEEEMQLFPNQVDGIWEDLDRLEGHAIEFKNYELIAKDIHEYRSQMKLPLGSEELDGKGLIFLTADNKGDSVVPKSV